MAFRLFWLVRLLIGLGLAAALLAAPAPVAAQEGTTVPPAALAAAKPPTARQESSTEHYSLVGAIIGGGTGYLVGMALRIEDGTGSCTGPGCQPDERISGAVAYVQVPALGATLGAGIGRLIPKGDWTPDVRPVAGSPGTFQVEWRVGVY